MSFVGYEKATIAATDFLNLADHSIYLRELASDLDEIVMVGERTNTELKIDRRVIHLGAGLQQSGTTALEAFEEEITDYLVKPYSYERFLKAVTRVKQQLSIEQKKQSKQLLLYADKTNYRIHTADILYLKAEVGYVKFVTLNRQILILDSLQSCKEKLSGFGFVRTHRSHIVNLDKIEKTTRSQVFIGDEMIPIGRTYQKRFIKRVLKD